MSNTEVTVTFELIEVAAVMGVIDRELESQIDILSDTTLALATAGTKLTDAFRTRND